MAKIRTGLRWNKQMIAETLGVTVSDLNYCMSKETIEAVGWTKGQQYFYDNQVYAIVKNFRRLATHEEILTIIYPKGIV